jgi:nucleoside 2-deoxyribosyltransferase
MPFSVYLAGPEVFLSNSIEVLSSKKAICEAHGLKGYFSLDLDMDLDGLSDLDKAYRISAANERLIRECNLVIANMTPYRGPSCDVGTAYEMGFAKALGLPVFAYTNCDKTFLERTKNFLDVSMREDGSYQDEDGMGLENFGCWDNLMLDGCVHASHGWVQALGCPHSYRYTSLVAFETCVIQASKIMRGATR